VAKRDPNKIVVAIEGRGTLVRAQTRTSASQRSQARQRRAERREEKLSRAQIKAMEVRAAETATVQAAAGVVTVAPDVAAG
jgi:hypothetical protein